MMVAKKRYAKTIYFICLNGFLMGTAFANVEYNPDQFKQFDQTNTCPGCDLSNINFTTMTNNHNHSGASLAGANLSGSLTGILENVPMNFSSADLNNANLSNVNFPSSNFSQAKLNDAALAAGNFTSANFTRADLTGAVLSGANLSYANFSQAINADLTNAKLCKTVMPDGSISQCN